MLVYPGSPPGGYITGPKAEVFKKWPLSPFKKKKNCLHKNWPMCACIYMVPRVLTGTDVYNCHHNENTEEFHHQNTRWPQTVLTLAMFADPTVLPFPEWHINGSLQHMAFLNWLSLSASARLHGWLSFYRGQCSRWGLPQWVQPFTWWTMLGLSF